MKRAVTFYVSDKSLQRLAKLAKRLEMSRSAVIDGLLQLPLKIRPGWAVQVLEEENGSDRPEPLYSPTRRKPRMGSVTRRSPRRR
jgi:hypothetical protein